MEEKTIQEELNLLQSLQQNPKEALGSYSHVILTEDELIEALIWAKCNKLEKADKERIKNIETENRKFREMQWNFDIIKTYMAKKAEKVFKGKFAIDDDNTDLFDLLCFYFINDEVNFNSLSTRMGMENTSVSKGILMCGNVGVGKTWMMHLFSRNQKQSYDLIKAKDIAEGFLTSKDKKIPVEYLKPYDTQDPEVPRLFSSEDVFYQRYIGMCIDDLGSESIKNSYGNTMNVIGDVIEIRYSSGFVGPFLHGTTNLSAEQIKAFYGERVTSRMRQSFNFIELTGKDRRK